MSNAVLTYAVARGVALAFWRWLLPEPAMKVFTRILKRLYVKPIQEVLHARSPLLWEMQSDDPALGHSVGQTFRVPLVRNQATQDRPQERKGA